MSWFLCIKIIDGNFNKLTGWRLKKHLKLITPCIHYNLTHIHDIDLLVANSKTTNHHQTDNLVLGSLCHWTIKTKQSESIRFRCNKFGYKKHPLKANNFSSIVLFSVSCIQGNRMPSNEGIIQWRFYCIGARSLETVDQLLALHTRDLDSHAQLTCSTVKIYWSALQARALTPTSHPSSISPAAEPFDPSVWWPAVYLLYDAVITTTIEVSTEPSL